MTIISNRNTFRRPARRLTHRAFSIIAAIAILFVVGVASTGTAHAQRGMWGSMWSPGVDDRDLEQMTQTFELDEDQRMVIDSLIDGYRTAFREGVNRVREDMRQAREDARASGDWQVMREVMEDSTSTWRDEAAALEQQLFADIRSMLTPEQEELWPKFERDRLRRTSLARGSRLSGESVDVIALVDEMELDEETRESLNPILEAYANELDPLIKERNRLAEAMTEDLSDFFSDEGAEDAERAWKRVQDRRIAIRTLNEQYMEAVANQLDLEQGEMLRQEFRRESHPRVYRDTEADRYLERVMNLETLTEDQIASLETVQNDYGQQIANVNLQLAAAERDREETAEGPMFGGRPGRRGGFFGGDGTDGGGMRTELERTLERMRELRDHKESIVLSQLDAIYAVLTPEQQELAPKPDPEARRQQMMEEMRQRRENRGRGGPRRGEDGEAAGG